MAASVSVSPRTARNKRRIRSKNRNKTYADRFGSIPRVLRMLWQPRRVSLRAQREISIGFVLKIVSIRMRTGSKSLENVVTASVSLSPRTARATISILTL